MKVEIRWFDIPAKDITRAAEFYSKLFDINLEVVDCSGGAKMACFPDGNGSIYQSKDGVPTTDGVTITYTVEGKIEEMTQKAVCLGGKLIEPVTEIEAESCGFFTLVLDREGNKIGFHSATLEKSNEVKGEQLFMTE